MVKKRGKKLVIQTEKKQEPLSRRTILPILENPFEISDEINRMFYRDPWVKPWWHYGGINPTTGNLIPEKQLKIVPVDLIDTGKGYEIIAEMPGVSKKDIDVVVNDKNISICGETETTIREVEEGYVKKERGYSTLCRYLRFPEDVNPDNAEAVLSEGILKIKVNKQSPARKGTRVQVK